MAHGIRKQGEILESDLLLVSSMSTPTFEDVMVFLSFLVTFCLPLWVLLFPQAPPFNGWRITKKALRQGPACALQASTEGGLLL